MGMHQYFLGMNQLEMIQRAPGFFKYQPHSVASHSWKVTQIAQFLADVEEQNGAEVNWKSLYEKALNHDYTERFVGDIKTPVKYATATLRSMLADVEDSMTDAFIRNEIPEEFQLRYIKRLGEGKDDTLEGRLLAVADKVDLLYEAFGELEKYNPEPVFVDIFQSSLEALAAYQQLPSVQYFAREVLPELFKTKFPKRDELRDLAESLLSKPV